MEHISNLDWKAIPGFPKYDVTPEGQVWSYYTNKFLKPGLSKHGYLTVVLCNDLGQSTCRVHRLVGKAFIPLPPEFNNNYDMATIDHVDGNKLNNHYTNLEWVTREENTSRAWENGYCDHLKKPCFLIDSLDNSYTPFDSCADIDRCLNLPDETTCHAIGRYNGLIRGRYIVGYLDDPRWKTALANPTNSTIAQIIESYAEQVGRHKSINMDPKKITNLQTGESKVYNSLSEFAKEYGLDPKNIGRYLKNHPDLYKVELA